MSEDERFICNLAKFYDCELKILDLNKINSYKKFLRPEKVTKYANRDFSDKEKNFLAVLCRNDLLLIDGERCESKKAAIASLKATYARRLQVHRRDFKYAHQQVRKILQTDWLPATTANEVELHATIRRG